MNSQLKSKNKNIIQRKHRVRSLISGTSKRPRLSVHVSNHNITAQIIDDEKHTTLCYTSTTGKKISSSNMTEKAKLVGKDIAVAAQKKKIKMVIFDRGSKLYHGRIAALAESAREEGLKF